MQRISNITLFFLAYVSAMLRVPSRRCAELRTVLVVPAGKLGDVVCTTPVMRAIRAHMPEAKILVEDSRGINSALLADSGLVDGYLALRTMRGAVRELRTAHIDAAVLTGPSLHMLAYLLFTGVPCIVAPRVVGGVCPQETRTYKWLARFVHTVPYEMGKYAPRERLRVLEPLSIVESNTTKSLGYSDEARKNAGAFLRAHGLAEKKFAIISPGAGNKIKQWPADRFARVAEHLVSRGLPVVVIGGVSDKQEVASMMRALEKPEGVVDASEKFSLDELKAFIAQAGLFVSVDTGPLYIAEAFGVPTVDITGPIDEREQPPIGPLHKVVVPQQRDKPQLFVLNARMYDEQEALRQVESIAVLQVTAQIDELTELSRI